MTQRVSIAQRIYTTTESAENTYVAPTAANAFLCDALAASIGDIPIAFLDRKFMGTMGAYQGKMGAREKAKISYSLEFRGNGSVSLTPEYDPMMLSIFPGPSGTGAAVSDTISSTATGGTQGTQGTKGSGAVVNTGSTTGIPASPGPYGAVMVETGSGTGKYELAWINSFVANTSITTQEALNFAPVSGATLKAARAYLTGDFGHPSLSHTVFLDSGAVGGSSDYLKWTGCKGNLKLDASKVGIIPKLTFDWLACDWDFVKAGTKLGMTVNATLPSADIASTVKVNGLPMDLIGFTLDLGQVVSQKTSQNASDGVFAQVVTQRLAKGTLKFWDISTDVPDPITDFKAGTLHGVSLQWGNTLFNTVGVYIPNCQFTKVKYAAENGMLVTEVDWQASITSGNDEVYFGLG